MNVEEVQKCRLQIAKSMNDKKDSFFSAEQKFQFQSFPMRVLSLLQESPKANKCG